MSDNTNIGPTPEELKKETLRIVDALRLIVRGKRISSVVNACAAVIMDAVSTLPDDDGKASVAKGLANMAQSIINSLGEKENG